MGFPGLPGFPNSGGSSSSGFAYADASNSQFLYSGTPTVIKFNNGSFNPVDSSITLPNAGKYRASFYFSPYVETDVPATVDLQLLLNGTPIPGSLFNIPYTDTPIPSQAFVNTFDFVAITNSKVQLSTAGLNTFHSAGTDFFENSLSQNFSTSFSETVPSGGTVFLFFGADPGTVSDSNGNTYTLINSHGTLYVYVAQINNGGNFTISYTNAVPVMFFRGISGGVASAPTITNVSGTGTSLIYNFGSVSGTNYYIVAGTTSTTTPTNPDALSIDSFSQLFVGITTQPDPTYTFATTTIYDSIGIIIPVQNSPAINYAGLTIQTL